MGVKQKITITIESIRGKLNDGANLTMSFDPPIPNNADHKPSAAEVVAARMLEAAVGPKDVKVTVRYGQEASRGFGRAQAVHDRS